MRPKQSNQLLSSLSGFDFWITSFSTKNNVIKILFVLNFVTTNCFTYIISFDIYNHPMGWEGQISLPFYKHMEPDVQMSHDLSKVTQLVVNRARYLSLI